MDAATSKSQQYKVLAAESAREKNAAKDAEIRLFWDNIEAEWHKLARAAIHEETLILRSQARNSAPTCDDKE